ncbi:MAG TPA: hypothetical protein VMA77_25970 [Solirubrobacteraceae bacterium]|nr:hypothetical protein [Solirubrobacteraceae bacterium]
MTASRQIAPVLAVIALAGCSLQHPYTPQTPNPRPTTTADGGDPPPERGGTIPAAAQAAERTLAPGAAQPTQQAAVARYATIAVNWNWRTLAVVQRRLASISLGQARAQAGQAAAQATADPTLAQERLADSGQPVAVAPGRGAAAGWWVIVTREHTTGQGPYADLPPTLHVTYAQLTHTPHGWLVTRWQPQT